MSDKIDIFTVLEYLDTNHFELYEVVSGDPDILKTFEKDLGWIIPIWFSGATNAPNQKDQTLLFNEVCNQCWFELSKHPELRAKLLAACGLGKEIKHKFYKPKSLNQTGGFLSILRQVYPDIKPEEVELFVRTTDRDYFYDLCLALGNQDDHMISLMEEFDQIKDRS